jgi:FkbM family methyltransferase
MRSILKTLFLPVLVLLETATDFHTSPLPQIAERLKMLAGMYEPGTTTFIKKRLQGGVAFDIGANVGYYARLMSPRAEHVYAFEPDPDNFALLQRNCRNFPNITPLNMAVGETTGTVDFFKVPNSAMRHSLIDEGGGTQKILVTCTSLDDFVREKGIAHVSLIKIDVEGAEEQVFAGMQELLKQRPVIIYEGYDPNGKAIADNGELVPAAEAPRLGAQQKVTNLVRE